ncbi:GM26226 [Drosophila sechellia]|uniref:GM26226 n=1 Tax=Drosophila sechellia TaxID=7238 RepID=B4HJV0_DROSE|nr:GM26226 [Drosophila sechellia]
MVSMQFVLQPLPGSDDQFIESRPLVTVPATYVPVGAHIPSRGCSTGQEQKSHN